MTSTHSLGRREFLGTVGASSLPSLLAPRTAAADGNSAGKLVFVYDDGTPHDYTGPFPVHEREGVPGCIAAVSGRIGTERGLTPAQLREIDSAGWEIMSHTARHRPLGSVDVTDGVQSGDTRVYVEANYHGSHPGDRIRIFDNDHEFATVTGGGSDDTGEYVTVENGLRRSFDADSAKIRYTDSRLRSSLRESKAQLGAYGVRVSNLVLPYGLNGRRARELIPAYYDAVANAKWSDGLNGIRNVNPYGLHRAYFRPGEMTERDLETYLDAVAENDVLGILAGHAAYEEFTAERVRTAIRMAKERDVAILTLREALAELGVVEPTTASTRTTTASTTTATGLTRTTATFTTTTTAEGTTSGTATSSATTSSNQSGLGAAAALAGLGLLAWRRARNR